jgi:hypothetical protein
MASAAVPTYDDLQVEHIGPRPHTMRNVLVSLGVLLMFAMIWFFYWRGETRVAPETTELSQIRAAIWNACQDERFKGPAGPEVLRAYAERSQLRTAVIEQYHALQRGQANCASVLTALRSVGYPIE